MVGLSVVVDGGIPGREVSTYDNLFRLENVIIDVPQVQRFCVAEMFKEGTTDGVTIARVTNFQAFANHIEEDLKSVRLRMQRSRQRVSTLDVIPMLGGSSAAVTFASIWEVMKNGQGGSSYVYDSRRLGWEIRYALKAHGFHVRAFSLADRRRWKEGWNFISPVLDLALAKAA